MPPQARQAQSRTALTHATLIRATVCAGATGLIVSRAFTHSIVVELATCLVVGIVLGALLRAYAKTRA